MSYMQIRIEYIAGNNNSPNTVCWTHTRIEHVHNTHGDNTNQGGPKDEQYSQFDIDGSKLLRGARYPEVFIHTQEKVRHSSTLSHIPFQ